MIAWSFFSPFDRAEFWATAYTQVSCVIINPPLSPKDVVFMIPKCVGYIICPYSNICFSLFAYSEGFSSSFFDFIIIYYYLATLYYWNDSLCLACITAVIILFFFLAFFRRAKKSVKQEGTPDTRDGEHGQNRRRARLVLLRPARLALPFARLKTRKSNACYAGYLVLVSNVC